VDVHALTRRLWLARTPLALLLLPLSWLFALVQRLRAALYAVGLLRTERLPVPAIVVGNFLAGGTGKTPLVLWLVQHLAERGLRPGVVSRGHGGRNAAPVAVTELSSAEEAGDEPLLLARRLGAPVWIGRNRVAAARALLDRHPAVDILVLDDGLQHRRLARDFEIAVFDERGTGNGFLLPAGPLRERPRAVDAVVRNGAPPADGEFAMRLAPAGFYRLHDDSEVELDWLRTRRLHAAAGIGRPDSFFKTLREMGLAFTPHSFPDHHVYAAGDLRFADCDAVLLTEKDAVKCVMFKRTDLIMLRVEADVDPALLERIAERLGPIRVARG
jgi:tetraacyldisaccharide 4'-kinase